MPIRIKVDVTKLDKTAFFIGKKRDDGTTPKYADLVIWETQDDKFGNDYKVVQDIPRERRDAGEKGAIVGNGKNFGSKPTGQQRAERQGPPPASKPPAEPDLDAAEDDIPFK